MTNVMKMPAELTSFKVEKGVPFPEVMSGSKYPFARMEVGDSFSVSEDDLKRITSVRTSAQKKTGFTFSVRKFGSAYRCWRTA